MDDVVSEEQIRSLAFQLWEEAGSPQGRSDEFWQQAKEQLGAQSGGPKESPAGEEGQLPVGK